MLCYLSVLIVVGAVPKPTPQPSPNLSVRLVVGAVRVAMLGAMARQEALVSLGGARLHGE